MGLYTHEKTSYRLEMRSMPGYLVLRYGQSRHHVCLYVLFNAFVGSHGFARLLKPDANAHRPKEAAISCLVQHLRDACLCPQWRPRICVAAARAVRFGPPNVYLRWGGGMEGRRDIARAMSCSVRCLADAILSEVCMSTG